MALISCPECKTEVSTEATKCPKCSFTLRKPMRSPFGKVVKWAFVGFNVLMVVWIIAGMSSASHAVQNVASDSERAGAQIGAGIGFFLLVVFWFLGSSILGIITLLTRPKA